MGFFFFFLIICGLVYYVRKGKSAPQPAAAVPAELFFTDHTDEERAARRERFDALMQGPDGATLAKCGEKVRNLFIPDKKGDYRGTLSGVLYENDRAKRLEKIDATVLPLLGRDPEAYEIWWMTLYEEALNLAAADNRLRGLVQQVLADVERGDALLTAAGAWEQLCNPDGAEHKIKISMPDGTVKIHIKEKHGRPFHEIKGAYGVFKTGLSIDPMVRSAEILMAVSGMFKGTQTMIYHEEVERYAVPSLSKLTE